MDLLQDLDILCLIVEVAKGREHIDHQVEFPWALELPHIRFHPFDRDTGLFCPLPGFRQKKR